MNAIEKSIVLLREHLETGNKEKAVEAHHMIGMYLDIRNDTYARSAKTTDCIDCGIPITRKSAKKGRCDACRDKRKLEWQKQYYKKIRSEK